MWKSNHSPEVTVIITKKNKGKINQNLDLGTILQNTPNYIFSAAAAQNILYAIRETTFVS